MNMYSKIYCLIAIVFFFSCDTTKKADIQTRNDTKKESRITNSQEMLDKGYSKGILSTSKSKECPYILTVEQYNDQLDPINLHDFFISDVPHNVWVKYSSLKMKNRCNNARPVSISEISKRDND